MQVEFPEQVQPPAGDIGQVERGRSGPAHAVRQHRELIEEVNVDVLMAPARRKAGGGQRVLHAVHLGHVNPLAVQKRSRRRARP